MVLKRNFAQYKLLYDLNLSILHWNVRALEQNNEVCKSLLGSRQQTCPLYIAHSDYFDGQYKVRHQHVKALQAATVSPYSTSSTPPCVQDRPQHQGTPSSLHKQCVSSLMSHGD